MNCNHILILDYSVDRSEAPAIQKWLPEDSTVSTLYIDTENSFPDDLADQEHSHVIHSGSALSITKPVPFTPKAIKYIRDIKDKRVAQMGICYGHQLICRALVGKHAVRKSPIGFEVGWNEVQFTENSVSIPGVREVEILWQHHFDEVIELPEGSILLASNQHTRIQAYIHVKNRLLGTQFHPEFDRDTGNGLYIKDRKLLEKHHCNIEEITQSGPSLEAGTVFFDFFLDFFKQQTHPV